MQRLSRCAARHSYARLDRHNPSGRALILWRPRLFSTSFKLHRKDDPEDHGIRFYEQVAPGPKGIRRIDREEFEDAEAKRIKTKIEELEKELKRLTSGTAFGLLSPEERKKIEASAVAEKNGEGSPTDQDQEDGLDDIEEFLEGDHTDLAVNFQLSEQSRVHLNKFNQVLRQISQGESSPKLIRELWVRYTRCKRELPLFIEQVPSGVWDILWETQYERSTSDPNRSARLWELLRDIGQTDKELSPVQKMVMIESLYANGNPAAAKQAWYSARDEIQQDEGLAVEFWKLGIQLETVAGDLEQAKHLALKAAAGNKETAVQLLTPAIGALVETGTLHGQKTAWSLYLYLRRLNPRLKLEEYDAIVLGLLKAKNLELALVVFKDLVLAGQNSEYDSTAYYKKVVQLHENLATHTSEVPDLNTISFGTLAVLPKRFQNKFFYASWMKRLISMGEIDGAASVMQLMYRRGLTPDAKHLNGVIGAWLRGTSSEDRELALSTGWAMVGERLKFVAERQASPVASKLNQNLTLSQNVPAIMRNNLPRATIETFCLLLLYYQRRNMISSIQQVQAALTEAEIPPNSFFMNHLLYWKLRQGDVKSAWTIYNDMTNHVKPDMETFSCLWDCEKAHLGQNGTILSGDFPGPRALFSAMMNWFIQLPEREKAKARAEFNKDIYNQIVRSFCFNQDTEGAIIALYTLKNSFNMLPDREIVRMVTIHLSRLSEEQPKHRRKRFVPNERNVQKLGKVTEILELIARQRTQALEDAGVDRAALTEEQQAEEALYLVTELLRVFVRRKLDDQSKLEDRLQYIAWDMGTGGYKMDESPLYTPSA